MAGINQVVKLDHLTCRRNSSAGQYGTIPQHVKLIIVKGETLDCLDIYNKIFTNI